MCGGKKKKERSHDGSWQISSANTVARGLYLRHLYLAPRGRSRTTMKASARPFDMPKGSRTEISYEHKRERECVRWVGRGMCAGIYACDIKEDCRDV